MDKERSGDCMIGAVIITHGEIAECLLEASESISGDTSNLRAISVSGAESTEDIRNLLLGAVKEVDRKKGVVIFTDMFGGTPSNIALSMLEEGKVEILTGVNLPILLKFISKRNDIEFDELLKVLVEYGHKSIVLASDMLKGDE